MVNDVYIVAEAADRAEHLKSDIAEHFSTRPILRHRLPQSPPGRHTIVDIDLAKGSDFPTLRKWLKRRPSGGVVIFAVDRGNHHQIVQAHALGATAIAPRAIDRNTLLAMLLGDIAALIDDKLAEPGTGTMAARMGVRALQRVFASVHSGAQLDLDQVDLAGGAIVSEIDTAGLAQWIEMVRMHHSQTYQHCLLTTGVAAAFALSLGFCAADQRKLAVAGLLHDLGKARIPVGLLEKPGPLDVNERAIIKQHPLLGFELLRNVEGLDSQMVDMVVQHHEYLDGSGYPYGLQGKQILDLARIVTIADVFSALIERRPYRPPLRVEAAYREIVKMGPKLDLDLVRDFGRIVAAANRASAC